MSRKPGQASHIKPLTPEEHQRLIRTLEHDPCPSIKVLAQRFNISAGVISRIRRELGLASLLRRETGGQQNNNPAGV